MTLHCLYLTAAKAQNTYHCSYDTIQANWLGNDSSRHYQKLYHEQRIDHLRYSNYVQSPLGNSNLIVQQGMSSGCRRVNYIIPVVFHVVYDPNDSTTNISDAQVQNQLQVLNDAFAGVTGGVNTGIQFCLAQKRPDNSSFNGINHIADSNPDYRKYSLQKNHLASKAYYDRTRYLNIWVVKDIRNIDNTPAYVGGYSNISYQGGIDGIVMLSILIGDYTNCSGCFIDPQSRGKALVHEVGHWLGLEHTFAGGCAAGDDSTNCWYRGDRCCDTRPHNFTTVVCPTPDTLTCSSLSSYYNNTSDPIHNYMSYTAEYCKDQFTSDQTSIMISEILLIRNSMIKIDNWIATNISCCNTSALFDANSTYRCNPENSVILKAYPYPNSVHVWKIYRNDTLLTTHTDTANTFTYNMPVYGKYDVSHVLIYNSYQDTTLPFRINSYIEYVDCGSNIVSPQANWTFGNEAALRFTSKGVFPSTKLADNGPNLRGEDNPICISDSSGNLLFYGQEKLYKKDYAQMDNNDLYINGTPYQGIVSFPQPFYHNRYYVVTTDGIEGLIGTRSSSACFRVVDTAAGTFSNGDVVTSRFFLKAPPTGSEFNGIDSNVFALEMLTAIPKCNGEDYWVIMIDASGLRSGTCGSNILCRDSTLGVFNNTLKLLVYEANNNGIDFHSVSDSSINIKGAFASTLKFSPDGNWLAIGNKLFRFNRQDGTIKYAFTILADTSSLSNALGSSFSPNSSVYYYISSSTVTKMYQVDLNSSSANNITSFNLNASYFNMQLAPNNKIYLSKNGATSLAVINYPDSICSPTLPNACGFTDNGQILTNQLGFGGVSTISLPNMVDAKKKEEIPLIIYHKDTACLTVNFSSSVCCANTFRWSFGDGDTSVQREPVHTYDSRGTYSVILIADLDTIYYSLTLGINSLAIAGSPFICDTGVLVSYSLTNPSDYLQYTWSIENGTGSPNYTEQEFNAVWQTSPGTIRVIAMDNKTGCTDSTSHTVTFKARVYDYNISAVQLLCDNDVPDTLIGDQPTGGFGYYNYQWYKSTDTGAVKTWTRITGANNKDYLPPFPQEDTYYKRVTDTSLCPMTSNTVLLNRAITNNTITADTSDCDDIIGSTPNSVNSFTYTWQRSIDSINWTNIPSQTGKDLTAPVYFRTTYVRRVVQDSVCTSYSNVITMQPSITTTVNAPEDTICPGNELNVYGTTPCSESFSITYRWQSLLPGDTEFVDLGGYGVYADLYNSSWSTECYLRRRSISAGDTLYSDTVFIASRELIDMIFPLSNESYVYRFCSGEDVPELDGSQPCNQQSVWAYQWQSCTDTTNNSWSDIHAATANNYNPPALFQTTFYRRRAVNTTTSVTSFTPVFAMLMRNPQITQQPIPTNVNEGSFATFTIQVSDMEIMHWQESYVNSGLTFYNDIQNSNNDTLLVKADACRQGKHYRVIVQNMCTLTDVGSDSATLTVTTFNYNLWSKDFDTDYSSEPSTGFIWNSPDIWNRKSNDAATTHQNPEHRSTAPNYVYVKIRNLGGAGQVSSIPAKVYLYWTFANTGEKWSKHWVHDFDADSVNGNWRTYQGTKHALGGLIDVLELSSLNAGAETTLYVPWYPPNPGVINGGTDTVNADVCFLSRIVTCEDEPYGMSHHEISDIGFNVRYNNNIITKNFVVYDTLQGNGKVRWAGNGNPRDDARTGRLVLNALNCNFFDYGEVYLHLNEDLQEAWYANGALGSGFTVVNDSTLRMDTCELVLENIIYAVEQQAWMGIQFNEKEDVTVTELVDEVFMFNLQEYLEEEDADTSIGGIVYAIPVLLYPPGIGALQKRNDEEDKHAALLPKLVFSAYPNPFSGELNITYSLPEDKVVSITVTNLLGQTIATPESNRSKNAGTHRLTLQSSAWSDGVYFITFNAGNEIIQKKVVLIR
jgi:hypothetical protein